MPYRIITDADHLLVPKLAFASVLTGAMPNAMAIFSLIWIWFMNSILSGRVDPGVIMRGTVMPYMRALVKAAEMDKFAVKTS